MSEPTWEDELTEAPKKKGISKWIWFCGGGCLLMTLVIVAAIAILMPRIKRWAQEARDPEKQWPKIERLLPYDERPPELSMEVGLDLSMAGMEMYTLRDRRGFYALIMHFGADQASKVRGELLNEEHAGGVFGMGGRKEMKKSKVRVQGRELEVLRFFQESGATHGSRASAGQSALIDVTPEDERGITAVQLVRVEGDTLISDDDINLFLKPFRIGPEHVKMAPHLIEAPSETSNDKK